MSEPTLVAYELRSEYAGTTIVYDTVEDKEADKGREVPVFQGGTVALSDGSTFNVGDRLAENDGLIVVEESNTFLTDVLNAYGPLKRVPVPEGASPNADLGDLSKTALKQRAAAAGLKTGGTKQELVERLEAHEASRLQGADTNGEGA